MNMPRSAVLLGLAALSSASFGASTDTFLNDQSLYGQPSHQGINARVVDLGSVASVSVKYGETITFRSESQQFSWIFDGLDRRAIDIAKIAPAGFAAKPMMVDVGRSAANRR